MVGLLLQTFRKELHIVCSVILDISTQSDNFIITYVEIFNWTMLMKFNTKLHTVSSGQIEGERRSPSSDGGDGCTVRTQRAPSSTLDSIQAGWNSGNFENPPPQEFSARSVAASRIQWASDHSRCSQSSVIYTVSQKNKTLDFYRSMLIAMERWCCRLASVCPSVCDVGGLWSHTSS